MKVIDGHALADMIKKEADARRDSGLYMLAGLVLGSVNRMPEAEAYTEAKKRIENMEKIIDQIPEPVKPEPIEGGIAGWMQKMKICKYKCPICGDYIANGDIHCDGCGRELIWDEKQRKEG